MEALNLCHVMFHVTTWEQIGFNIDRFVLELHFIHKLNKVLLCSFLAHNHIVTGEYHQRNCIAEHRIMCCLKLIYEELIFSSLNIYCRRMQTHGYICVNKYVKCGADKKYLTQYISKLIVVPVVVVVVIILISTSTTPTMYYCYYYYYYYCNNKK